MEVFMFRSLNNLFLLVFFGISVISVHSSAKTVNLCAIKNGIDKNKQGDGSFLDNLLSEHKKNSTKVKNALADASSLYSDYVVSNAPKLNVLEIASFKLRNKSMCDRLGPILLTVMLEFADVIKAERGWSVEKKNLLEAVLINIGANTLSGRNADKKVTANFNTMIAKFRVFLNFILVNKLGLSTVLVGSMEQRLAAIIASEFNDKEIENLCGFVNKNAGGFDFMLSSLDVFWNKFVENLK